MEFAGKRRVTYTTLICHSGQGGSEGVFRLGFRDGLVVVPVGIVILLHSEVACYVLVSEGLVGRLRHPFTT